MNINFNTTTLDHVEYCYTPWDSATEELLYCITKLISNAKDLGFTFDENEHDHLNDFIYKSEFRTLVFPIDAISSIYATQKVCRNDKPEVKMAVYDACINAWDYFSEWSVENLTEYDLPAMYLTAMQKTKSYISWLTQYVTMDDDTWAKAKDALKLMFFLKIKGLTVIDIIEMIGRDNTPLKEVD